jgi:hypothetical protein
MQQICEYNLMVQKIEILRTWIRNSRLERTIDSSLSASFNNAHQRRYLQLAASASAGSGADASADTLSTHGGGTGFLSRGFLPASLGRDHQGVAAEIVGRAGGNRGEQSPNGFEVALAGCPIQTPLFDTRGSFIRVDGRRARLHETLSGTP